jgi:hypothetical protein
MYYKNSYNLLLLQPEENFGALSFSSFGNMMCLPMYMR